ncbi:MAG: hypothetical protein J6K91_05935 [Opitutales bacterium]|nr:hypothetical protein [Opitutales bacterium]
MNIDKIKAQLTEVMISLRSVEHNSSYAKAASYVDYALKELKSATPQEEVPSRPAIADGVKVEANTEEDSDEANNTPSDDDYEISQAGGANPADDANFGLTPAK